MSRHVHYSIREIDVDDSSYALRYGPHICGRLIDTYLSNVTRMQKVSPHRLPLSVRRNTSTSLQRVHVSSYPNAQNDSLMASRLVSMLQTLHAIRAPLPLPPPATLSLTVFRRPTTRRSTSDFRALLKASLSKCIQSEATQAKTQRVRQLFARVNTAGLAECIRRKDWSRTVFISSLPDMAIEEDIEVMFKESKFKVYVHSILLPSVMTEANIPLTIFTAIVSSCSMIQ